MAYDHPVAFGVTNNDAIARFFNNNTPTLLFALATLVLETFKPRAPAGTFGVSLFACLLLLLLGVFSNVCRIGGPNIAWGPNRIGNPIASVIDRALAAGRLRSLRFALAVTLSDSASLTSIIGFGSVRFGSVRFSSVRFGSIRFGSVRFGSIRLCSICLSSISFC
ncbi:MAG: hypothetical protein SH859_08875 [Hyphomicrobium aestuarii]|nr:hypothetical protein [Hyphomicrobium aestuarii]